MAHHRSSRRRYDYHEDEYYRQEYDRGGGGKNYDDYGRGKEEYGRGREEYPPRDYRGERDHRIMKEEYLHRKVFCLGVFVECEGILDMCLNDWIQIFVVFFWVVLLCVLVINVVRRNIHREEKSIHNEERSIHKEGYQAFHHHSLHYCFFVTFSFVLFAGRISTKKRGVSGKS